MATLFKNWDFMRFLRLAVGVWVGYLAFAEGQIMYAAISGIFLLQALLNMGCGNQGCGVQRPTNVEKDKTEEVTFEEIK